ncbi:unnamed protein product [Calicophoron daubneyi]|uniref:SOCS box domain-containing protein n=1 Tax=Calicophoron daubneyi TaxID=300641 RepID=A0AAV2TZ41_CALDB
MGLKYSKQRHKPRISKTQIPWLLRGAIRSNNVETLQYLFSYPNKVDPSMVIDGVCPLNLAVELGYLQMVKILIKAGADIYVADAPRYPLHQASLYGRAAIADLLIKSGASVSALTERRQSCLHLLAHQSAERFVETAHILMKNCANPNTLDDDGLAPLHRASVEMVYALASYDVTDMNICSRDGDTPLLTAVKDRRELVLLALLRADQLYCEHKQEQQLQQLDQNSVVHAKELATVGSTEETTTVERMNHCVAVRSSSSKSSNSAASRLTLASAASAIFHVGMSATGDGAATAAGGGGVIRAASAASVNVHSVAGVGNHRKGLITGGNIRHGLRTAQPTCISGVGAGRSRHGKGGRTINNVQDAAAEEDGELIVGAKLRSCLSHLSAKNFRIQSFPDPSDEPVRSTVASSYAGSTNFFGGSRKTENCQRCHSVGNPSDVSGWWQGCDRVQRILSKAASSVHASNSTYSPRQVNMVSLSPSTAPLPTQPPSVRPRLELNKPDKIGMTALMLAAEAGNSGLNMTVALVNAGCNVAAVDKVGMTALHHGCYVGSLNVVRYLLERVLPVTSSGGGAGSTMASFSSGVKTTASFKTTATTTTTTTANTGSPKSHGATAGNSSNTSSNTDGVTVPSNATGTCLGIAGGRLVIPELLDSQDKYGRTPIYLAACRGHTEVVNYLLSHSADIHIPNKEHKSPLYISAYFGYLEITNALLRHGAQVDQTDSHRKTPLYVATYHGRSEIVDLLLDAGANVNAADKNGKTPLYIAVLHGHLALAQKLLNAGASVNRVDREGLGPLHMAVKFPKLDIPMVKLLLNYGCDPVNLASFTRWLLIHGIIPEEYIHGDDELAEWLYREECNVRSLKRLCRVAIQRALGNTDSMRVKLRRLPLPEHLLSYVSMKEL